MPGSFVSDQVPYLSLIVLNLARLFLQNRSLCTHQQVND